MGRRMVEFAVGHAKLVVALAVVLTVALGLQMPRIRIDTDPENMLSEDEPVRVFHNAVKEEFALYDFVIVGLVSERDGGVFNPESLARVWRITEAVKGFDEVVASDVIAPSTKDAILQGGPGTVEFRWLMAGPPGSSEAARQVRDLGLDNPVLRGSLVSEDGQALCLFIPVKQKDASHAVARRIRALFAEEGVAEGAYSDLAPGGGLRSEEDFYFITGLPVAEDTFGVEMFRQMAVSAPLAAVIIFLIMLLFFRKVSLILSPMIVAMVSVICTMGLLIGMGNTVHIMSSMIPIFLMPISVVDSVHILSEFFDQYQKTGDRRRTILSVMDHLFMPMLYTSLTSAAGFASLALTPIPPVQVFGMFVAFGIMLAWVLTVVFIPAYVMLLPGSSLERFGRRAGAEDEAGRKDSCLSRLGRGVIRRSKLILAVTGVVIVVSAVGISRIVINDNPVKWFTRSHPIRVADRVLNGHFGGTYPAYLILEWRQDEATLRDGVESVIREVQELEFGEGAGSVLSDFEARLRRAEERALSTGAYDLAALLTDAYDYADEMTYETTGDEADAWFAVLDVVEGAVAAAPAFKSPDVLEYMRALQEHMVAREVVGKTASVADVVAKVYKELMGGGVEHYRVPGSAKAVGQCLLQFQNSHNPNDLWHMVTPDYTKANVWVQLHSGDNRDMESVVRLVDTYVEGNPPPRRLDIAWAGLTYLNVEWQERMVSGMLRSLMGSFLIVLLMMVFLYRSIAWGLLSMVPLSVTIAFIYGLIGLLGKDYDMPVAVLSSLTLGLSVDFAIHFLERTRMLQRELGSWRATAEAVFEAPARAISRNALVIAIGFTPLLAAPLVPYKTVGFFLAAIMAVSGLCTLLVLPSLVDALAAWLFRERLRPALCSCWSCLATSLAAVAGVAWVAHRYTPLRWSAVVWLAAAWVIVLAVLCNRLAQRAACAPGRAPTEE